ncbi:MAG: pullulanase-type alpha-1,6-glucosidase, partial [Myxococcales bacterium]|nr:pullulanase-type alpha-1,6-glucosidase [Myxococcales bacterium]
MRLARTLAFTLTAALALAAAACGDDGGGNEKDTASPADTADATDTADTAVGTDSTDEDTGGGDVVPDTEPGDTAATNALALHYHRADGAYDGVTVTVSGDVDGGPDFTATGTDGFGAVFSIPLADGATTVSYRFNVGGATDPAEDPVAVTLADVDGGVWHFSGGEAPLLREPPAIPDGNQLVVYYLRDDDAYSGWGLHTWMDVASETAWTAPLMKAGTDEELGAYFVVELAADAASVGIIVHSGDTKDPGPDMIVDLPTLGDMIFLTTGSTEIHPYPTPIPEFSIAGASAHWIDQHTIAWTSKGTPASYELRWAKDGSIDVEGPDVTGGTVVPLTVSTGGLTSEQKAKWPAIASRKALVVPASADANLTDILESELVVVSRDAGGVAIDATRVQTPGVLDDVYASDGELGVTWQGDVPHLAVWAPTAQNVRLQHIGTDMTLIETVDMTRQSDGRWTYDAATAAWKGHYYRYEVTAFYPISGRVQTTTVTDPYSVGLATGSQASLLANLGDPALKPEGWDALVKPPLDAFEDIVLYEAHVRDFSATDETVPAADRGKFSAFTYNGEGGKSLSDGMSHLKALATAGLTHVHLLPSFDIATINERAAERVDIEDGFDALCAKNGAVPAAMCTQYGTTPIKDVLAGLDPTTGDAQQIATWMAGIDGFNWGYDPFHYTVPEGSYATDPMGSKRTLEFRQMVKGLAQIGLRAVMDVVYNHTNSSGVGDSSVLDKVVPGYYHRLNVDSGLVETSTCCANTATEHAMMRRLMVDSIVTWARAYKVDGFRFDLMGHHMKADILAVRAALDALTIEDDGVDGAKIYLYGEGWDFGEVASNARGTNATQLNMAGTGVGTFNDRIRDAVRGGSAFDGGQDLRRNQGFANGLYVDPNDLATADDATKTKALIATDLIKVSMAGGLRTFKLKDRFGNTKTGYLVAYNGANGGYTLDPQEIINYVSAHDNQTLFDINA